jgi:hypothetical protein
MNKFEALKQFQAWPPEHQRLCAEYWIETGEDRPAVQSPMYDDPIPMPSYQPKAAAKVAAKPARNNMRYTRNELIEVDSHVSERRGPKEVARIMDKKYPRQRTIYAWEKMATRISKVGLQAMLDRAIDVEFK